MSEEAEALKNQLLHKFVEKMRKDLKEQHNAVFFSEVNPEYYPHYTIKLDNGKYYLVKVFYRNGEMILELLEEKTYLTSKNPA